MTYAEDAKIDLPDATPDENRGGADIPASSKSKRPDPVCVVTGEPKEKERMLRFVIGPENVLYPDFSENLPGEALWCNLYRETLDKALTENRFAAVSGKPVAIPEDIIAQIERGLRHQGLSMVSMARKAGKLVTGAEKTEQIVKTGRATIYLTASPRDGDTRQKISFHAEGNDTRIVDIFTTEELSNASGVNKVVHAAILRSQLAERLFTHVKRITLFNKR